MNLFAFGSNGSGQLALGHKEDVPCPTQCLFSTPTIQDDEIVHIAAGGNHTLLLTKRGCVYAAGCNSDGRCGPTPPAVYNENLNADGRCGPTPPAVYNENLNADEEGNLLRFRRVVLTDENGSLIEFFKCVSATWEGSVLVAVDPDEDGDRIFVLGSSPKGELGLGSDVKVTAGASLGLPLGTTVTALASGMGHSVAVTSNGDVFGWGGARKGQLGESLKNQKVAWKPAKVEGIPFRATAAVCGREFTVVLGQREAGEFVVLGDPGNRWGILDVPSLEGKGCIDIGASWHGIYVHFVSETGSSGSSVMAWGRNDRGQLPPPGLPEPVRIAVGSEHVLALLDGGKVATFGWGEHGNCGPDTDEQGNVSGTYNLVSLPNNAHVDGAKIVGVGAGCATSWVIVK